MSASPIPDTTLRGLQEQQYPSWDQARLWWLQWQHHGCDYTEFEARSAFLALQASGWMWGKNRVADPRAALERQIQTDRGRKQEAQERGHADKPDLARMTEAEILKQAMS